jgi:circadian clock protein KaiB
MKNKSKLESANSGKICLQLYITGMSENSVRAIKNVTLLCDQYLDGRVDLEIIDIYKTPAIAEEEQIIFSPSLVRQLPLPKKTFIGDLSEMKKVILGLGITCKE